MALIEIRKKGTKNFLHISGSLELIASDLRLAAINNKAFFTRENGAPFFTKDGYLITEISVYDDTGAGTEETFISFELLFQRLVNLGYPAFFEDGEVNLNPYALKGKRYINETVSGSISLDLATYDTFNLTLIGNTTLSIPNVLSSGEVKPFTIYITGNFALTLSGVIEWSGSYDGTKDNRITGEQKTDLITVVEIITQQ